MAVVAREFRDRARSRAGGREGRVLDASGAAGRPSDRGFAAAPPLVPPAMAPAAPPRLPRGPRSERAPTVEVEGCRLVWEVMGTRETRGHTRGAGGETWDERSRRPPGTTTPGDLDLSSWP